MHRFVTCKGDKWQFAKIKSSLAISLSSKVGTGAIIGVLAAMSKLHNHGMSGESIVLWVLVGMLVLVPITYCEVFLCQVNRKTPREFIEANFNKQMGLTYTISLVFLYCFGFVGFQLTGIQSVVKILSTKYLQYEFTPVYSLIYIVLPLILIVALIIITKNQRIFINSLGFMISGIVIFYTLLFTVFVYRTKGFIPEYIGYVIRDFLNIKSAFIGIPIGFIIGFQRIIQISETSLGTSALASHGSDNTPKREALLQSIATVMTIFIAVVITSYIFTYGKYHVEGVYLSGLGWERIGFYIATIKDVVGNMGLVIIVSFFIFSGLSTVLGSYHFVSKTLKLSDNQKIIVYLGLVSASGVLSISNFDIIFEAADLLMFIVGTINILSMFKFTIKYKNLLYSAQEEL